MLHYLIQITLFQALFFLVYELLLKKETFFTGNRAYLLVTQALVLLLPFLHFPQIQESIPPTYQSVYTVTYSSINKVIQPVANTSATTPFQFHWEWLIYLGAIISLILFSIKLLRIYKTIYTNEKQNHTRFKIIAIADDSTAFSFLNYIFIGNEINENKQQEIIKHELIHIQQKHSLDLLFFEILRILFWFNPFIYIYQKRITETHEFLVDQELAQNVTEKKQYYETILSAVFNTENLSFSSPFYNPSLIKKRIQMLTKMKSSNRRRLKYFFIVPILALSTTYVACNENSKQLAVLINDTNWHSTNYKTGDAIKAFQYIPQVQKDGGSWIIYNANKQKDIVVKIIENDSDTMYRDVYIKPREEATIKNLPLGRYYLKITLGNDWKEMCTQGDCFGKFTKNIEYKKLYFSHLKELKMHKDPFGQSSIRHFSKIK